MFRIEARGRQLDGLTLPLFFNSGAGVAFMFLELFGRGRLRGLP